MKTSNKTREIELSEVCQELPPVCVTCGNGANLTFTDHVFSYKTIVGLLGGVCAGIFSFGILTVSLSYSLEHILRLRFCSKCLDRAKHSERNGLIAAVLVFVSGLIVPIAAIGLLMLVQAAAGGALTRLPYFGQFFYTIFDSTLLILVGGFFLFAIMSPIARWAVERWSEPSAVIFRDHVLLKIPKHETVKIHVGPPKVRLDIA